MTSLFLLIPAFVAMMLQFSDASYGDEFHYLVMNRDPNIRYSVGTGVICIAKGDVYYVNILLNF